jgi:hypothetical protein
VEVSEETLIAIRANEILTGVWVEMSARMYSKSTSKAQFFESNMNRALDLADKELQAEKDKEKQAEVLFLRGHYFTCISNSLYLYMRVY